MEEAYRVKFPPGWLNRVIGQAVQYKNRRDAADEMYEALSLIIADRKESASRFSGREIPIRNSSLDAGEAALRKARGEQ